MFFALGVALVFAATSSPRAAAQCFAIVPAQHEPGSSQRDKHTTVDVGGNALCVLPLLA